MASIACVSSCIFWLPSAICSAISAALCFVSFVLSETSFKLPWIFSTFLFRSSIAFVWVRAACCNSSDWALMLWAVSVKRRAVLLVCFIISFMEVIIWVNDSLSTWKSPLYSPSAVTLRFPLEILSSTLCISMIYPLMLCTVLSREADRISTSSPVFFTSTREVKSPWASLFTRRIALFNWEEIMVVVIQMRNSATMSVPKVPTKVFKRARFVDAI